MNDRYLDFQLLLYVPAEQWESCVRFYRTLLGAEPFYSWDGSPDDRGQKFRVGGAVIVVLAQQRPFPQDPAAPVSFQLETSDVETLYRRLSANPEVVITQAPFTRPYGWRVFRVNDPVGNHINLYQVPGESLG